MALVSSVNTSDKFLASASNTDFKNSKDTDRYKQFISAAPSTGTLDPEMVKLNSLTTTVLSKIKSAHFGNIDPANMNIIYDMILDNAESVLEVGGDLYDRANLKSKMGTICGGFDSGIYSKYGGIDDTIAGFSLSALLAALLCMAVKGAITVITSVVKTLGLVVGTVLDIISSTLDALVFNPAKNIYNGVTKGVFTSLNRAVVESGLDVDGMLADVINDPDLAAGIKDTSTIKRMLSGYLTSSTSSIGINPDTQKYEDYLDLLLTDWSVSSLSSTRNAGTNILSNSMSKIIPDDFSFNVVASEIDKKDFMKLLS